MLRQPVTIRLQRQAAPAVGITQAAYPVAQEVKAALFLELLQRGILSQALVFTRTKHRADRLADFLVRQRVEAARIHGNRSQGQRTQALAGFKNGTFRVLVATDIAARGIDVEALSHVVNFDVPVVPDDYIHRVGRTGRAETTGDAFTFVAPQEEGDLRAIERAHWPCAAASHLARFRLQRASSASAGSAARRENRCNSSSEKRRSVAGREEGGASSSDAPHGCRPRLPAAPGRRQKRGVRGRAPIHVAETPRLTVSLLSSLRRAAQYFFMRTLTAFFCAAVIGFRWRRARAAPVVQPPALAPRRPPRERNPGTRDRFPRARRSVRRARFGSTARVFLQIKLRQYNLRFGDDFYLDAYVAELSFVGQTLTKRNRK